MFEVELYFIFNNIKCSFWQIIIIAVVITIINNTYFLYKVLQI